MSGSKIFVFSAYLLGLFAYHGIRAAEPIVEVPPLPTGELLEIYEDSEELFAIKLLEYYRFSAILETQLDMMGVTPSLTAPIPTLEQLSDADGEVLQQYAALAKALEDQVYSTPSSVNHQELTTLRQAYKDQLKTVDSLQAQVFRLGVNQQSISYYRESMMQLISDNDSIIMRSDSLRMQDYERFKEREASIRNTYEAASLDTEPVIAIAAKAITPIFNNDDLRTELSPGAELIFHTYPIFGFGKNIQINVGYMNPLVVVDDEDDLNSITAEYENHVYSFGIMGGLPGIVSSDDIDFNLRFGAAAYWGHGNAPNTALPDNKWQGQMLDLQIGVAPKNKLLPAELILGYSLMFSNRDLNFASPTTSVELGNTNIHILEIGLRINLWSL
jgi:hypothetical protein